VREGLRPPAQGVPPDRRNGQLAGTAGARAPYIVHLCAPIARAPVRAHGACETGAATVAFDVLEGKIATAYTKMYFASVCIFFFASGPTPVESERGDRGHQRRWGSPRCGTSPACTIQCSWTARTGELARACPFSCAALRTKCRSPPDCRLTKTFSTLSFVTVGDKYGQTPYKAPRFSGKQFQTVGLKQGRTANTYFTSPSSTRRGLRGNRAAHARAHAFDRFVHRIRR
jgi:hypothetical protein